MALLGLPLLFVGVVVQALQAARGRPGYPWKLGLAMALGGALTWPDLVYREEPGGPLLVQPMPPILLACGVWILAWWPLARRWARGTAT